MEKIPSLFVRDLKTHRVIDELSPFVGDIDVSSLRATIKWDGTSCLWAYDWLYKRFELREGKKVADGDDAGTYLFAGSMQPASPEQMIPGFYWKKVTKDEPGDIHHLKAMANVLSNSMKNFHTYELIGPGVQGNPYHLEAPKLEEHGISEIVNTITPNGHLYQECIEMLNSRDDIEGIVFWSKEGENSRPVTKIKRRDFGLAWPPRK